MYDQVTARGEAAPIVSHRFTAPTAAESRAALSRVVGPQRGAALWEQACAAAGIDPDADPVPADDLRRATEALAGHGGAVATVARAIQIRLRTYARLAARAIPVEATP